MESLVICIGEGRGTVAEVVRGGELPITLGRGLDNTVVLTDPYVGQRQLEFLRHQEHWYVRLTDDVNPVFINDALVEERELPVHAGDRITVGRTHLDIYPENYQVEPARKLLLSRWLYSGGAGLAAAFTALLGVALLDGFLDYLQFDQTNEWKAYLTTAIATASIILVWSGLWALMGRLSRHQGHFTIQMLVTSLVCGLIFLVMPLQSYIEYMFSSTTAGNAAGYLLATVMLALLLRWNIYFATHPARPWFAACTISVMCIVTYYGVTLLQAPDFNLRPQYSATLKPPFALPGESQSINKYLIRVGAIAESLTLQQQKGSD